MENKDSLQKDRKEKDILFSVAGLSRNKVFKSFFVHKRKNSSKNSSDTVKKK